jgi:hypothetical protein
MPHVASRRKRQIKSHRFAHTESLPGPTLGRRCGAVRSWFHRRTKDLAPRATLSGLLNPSCCPASSACVLAFSGCNRDRPAGSEREALATDSQVVRRSSCWSRLRGAFAAFWEQFGRCCKTLLKSKGCRWPRITKACDLCNTPLKTAGFGLHRGVPLLRRATGWLMVPVRRRGASRGRPAKYSL